MLKVLAYHKIEDVLNFEKQIVFLKKRYTLISYQDLNNIKHLQGKDKNPPLLITFDDGDISLYNNAYPLLKKHEIPAVIFVITGLLGTEEPFWWDKINYYSPEHEDSNATIWEVKKWPNQRREEFIKKLEINSKKKKFRYSQLTFEQLVEMKTSGIEIANHSHTHPMFDCCTSAEIETEIQVSMKILKEENFVHDIFAYPNGNFSEESEEIIRRSGIQMAFLFDHKINSELAPLRISRLIVNDTTPLWKFNFILSGWHSKLLPLKKRISKFFH